MKQKIKKRQNRFFDTNRYEYPQIRVYHKAGYRKRSPRYLLKCGDCDQKIQIYYAEDGLEIGGVHGSIEDWRDILLPLLMVKNKPDYTKWRRDLWQGKSVEEISNEAMRYRRTHRLRKIGSARKTATKRNK